MGRCRLSKHQAQNTQIEVAYRSLRPALTMPPRLEPDQERWRDSELLIAMLLLALLGAMVPLLLNVARPERTAVPDGADVVIDRDGKIVVTKVGEVDEAQLREQVTALLRGETP